MLKTDVADAIRALGAKYRIVGVTTGITEATAFFPDLSSIQSIGKWSSPDIEALLTLNPDVVFTYGSYPTMQAQLRRSMIISISCASFPDSIS